MNKALLWLPGTAASPAIAQGQWPNFSGQYLIQDQNGQVQLTITQTGCSQIRIDRRATSRGRTTTEQHTLKIDGQVQNDTPWMGSADRLQTSAKFVSAALEIVARPAAPKSPSDFAWRRLLVVRSNGDVDIRAFNKQNEASSRSFQRCSSDNA